LYFFDVFYRTAILRPVAVVRRGVHSAAETDPGHAWRRSVCAHSARSAGNTNRRTEIKELERAKRAKKRALRARSARSGILLCLREKLVAKEQPGDGQKPRTC